eukprot:1598357-Amphidinium_carterae.2
MGWWCISMTRVMRCRSLGTLHTTCGAPVFNMTGGWTSHRERRTVVYWVINSNSLSTLHTTCGAHGARWTSGWTSPQGRWAVLYRVISQASLGVRGRWSGTTSAPRASVDRAASPPAWERGLPGASRAHGLVTARSSGPPSSGSARAGGTGCAVFQLVLGESNAAKCWTSTASEEGRGSTVLTQRNPHILEKLRFVNSVSIKSALAVEHPQATSLSADACNLGSANRKRELLGCLKSRKRMPSCPSGKWLHMHGYITRGCRGGGRGSTCWSSKAEEQEQSAPTWTRCANGMRCPKRQRPGSVEHRAQRPHGAMPGINTWTRCWTGGRGERDKATHHMEHVVTCWRTARASLRKTGIHARLLAEQDKNVTHCKDATHNQSVIHVLRT